MDGLEQDRQLLQALCEFAGLTPSRLATEAGLATSTTLRTINGSATSRLSQITLDKLRARFPDYPGWLQPIMSDERLAFRGVKPEPNPDLVEIDQVNTAYGLGGTFVEHESIEVQKVAFSRSWLRLFTHSPPHLLFTTDGVGDSMEPTISDHDVIIGDRGQTRLEDVKGDKIWACVFGGVGMVKRLRSLPDGTVRIMSDNQLVRDEIATDGDLFIVGRIVAVAKRH